MPENIEAEAEATVAGQGTCVLWMRRGQENVMMALAVRPNDVRGTYRVYFREVMGCDRFVDLAAKSDEAVARYCRQLGKTYIVMSAEEFHAWYALAVTDTRYDGDRGGAK